MSNLAKISFSFADTGVNKFVDDEATAIKATITVSPSDISYKDLTLVMNMNPAEKVAAAIKDPFLLLPQGLSNDVNDPKTKAAVLKAVKDNNPNVTQDFTLKSLTYTNDATSLVVNQEIKVIATIAFDGAEAMKNLYIVLAGTADEVGKLLDKQLKMSVPTGTNLNLSENAILKKQIFALTTNLLPPVLASQSMIQLTDKKLQIGDNSIAVNITIPTKDGESSKAQTTLNVNLSSNDGDTWGRFVRSIDGTIGENGFIEVNNQQTAGDTLVSAESVKEAIVQVLITSGLDDSDAAIPALTKDLTIVLLNSDNERAKNQNLVLNAANKVQFEIMTSKGILFTRFNVWYADADDMNSVDAGYLHFIFNAEFLAPGSLMSYYNEQSRNVDNNLNQEYMRNFYNLGMRALFEEFTPNQTIQSRALDSITNVMFIGDQTMNNLIDNFANIKANPGGVPLELSLGNYQFPIKANMLTAPLSFFVQIVGVVSDSKGIIQLPAGTNPLIISAEFKASFVSKITSFSAIFKKFMDANYKADNTGGVKFDLRNNSGEPDTLVPGQVTEITMLLQLSPTLTIPLSDLRVMIEE